MSNETAFYVFTLGPLAVIMIGVWLYSRWFDHNHFELENTMPRKVQTIILDDGSTVEVEVTGISSASGATMTLNVVWTKGV